LKRLRQTDYEASRTFKMITACNREEDLHQLRSRPQSATSDEGQIVGLYNSPKFGLDDRGILAVADYINVSTSPSSSATRPGTDTHPLTPAFYPVSTTVHPYSALSHIELTSMEVELVEHDAELKRLKGLA
jgi:hypothetical protein